MARPGYTTRCGAVRMYMTLSLSMDPQSKLGGRDPKPRKLNADMARMARAMPNVARTMTGEIQLGMIWTLMM